MTCNNDGDWNDDRRGRRKWHVDGSSSVALDDGRTSELLGPAVIPLMSIGPSAKQNNRHFTAQNNVNTLHTSIPGTSIKRSEVVHSLALTVSLFQPVKRDRVRSHVHARRIGRRCSGQCNTGRNVKVMTHYRPLPLKQKHVVFLRDISPWHVIYRQLTQWCDIHINVNNTYEYTEPNSTVDLVYPVEDSYCLACVLWWCYTVAILMPNAIAFDYGWPFYVRTVKDCDLQE